MHRRRVLSLILIFALFLTCRPNSNVVAQSEVQQQPAAKQFPLKRKFPGYSKLTIYPSKEAIGQPVVVEGGGTWTLLFEPTDKPNLVSVRIVDVKVTYAPFRAVFDLNRDGQPEPIEVGSITLGSHDFDLEISKGSLNLETGEFSLLVGHLLTPKSIPVLAKLGIGPLKFSFTEKGLMDLEAGKFEAYAGAFSLPAPFDGVMLSVKEGGAEPRPDSEINLVVNVIEPPVDPLPLIEYQHPTLDDDTAEEITICPADTILLSWAASSDVTKARLAPASDSPDTGDMPGTGDIASLPGVIGDVQQGSYAFSGPPTDKVYKIEVTQGNTPGVEDTAEVFVWDDRDSAEFTATPEARAHRWSLTVHPESFSGNIKLTQIRMITPPPPPEDPGPEEPEETGYEDCFDWPRFSVEHFPSGEAGPHTITAEARWSSRIPGHHRVAGRWYFRPLLPDGEPADAEIDWDDVTERQPFLCFEIRGECRRD